MGWVGRLFDERSRLARLLLLDASGLAYLLFGPQAPTGRPAAQWVLAGLAFVTILGLYRLPFTNLVVQAALLAVSYRLLDDPTISEVGASWVVLEVGLARQPRMLWLGAALLAAVALTFGGVHGGIGAVLLGLSVSVGLPALLGLNIRTSRDLARQAEERAAEERQRRESESRAARADERSAIARELHDVVAHHVASMVLRVGVARHVLPADPRVAEVLDDIHGTGTAALADLRKLVAVLRDPNAVRDDAALTAIEPAALPAALGAAVDRARHTGVTVEADIASSVAGIDAVRGLAVLRLTQEALTNVAKHVGAPATARLTVTVTADDAVRWEVCDDGGATGGTGGAGGAGAGATGAGATDAAGGTDAGGAAGGRRPSGAGAERAAARPVGGGGHGLIGMRERVEVLGGRLEAGPHDGGWRLHTTLPALIDAGGASTGGGGTGAAGVRTAALDGELPP